VTVRKGAQGLCGRSASAILPPSPQSMQPLGHLHFSARPAGGSSVSGSLPGPAAGRGLYTAGPARCGVRRKSWRFSFQKARRPLRARASVSSSAYSRSPPTGRP
jgi:hypothetical protein